MKINKFIKYIAAGVLAISAVASSAPTVLAVNDYNPVSGGTVQFEKYLIYDAKAMPPEIEFSFTLDADGNELAPAAGCIAVYSGDDASIIADNANEAIVSVGKAAFTYNTTKYTSVQALDSSVDFGKHATITNDPVDLTGGKAYSRVPVTIDFSNAKFTEPGVYRWKITEDANATASGMGITLDDADHFIDVYVNAGSFDTSTGKAELTIAGYVFHTNSNFQPTSSSTAEEPADGKAKGFTNVYETHNVNIKELVSGNQAAHDKYFKYTVTISNAGANNKILAEGSFDRTTANDATNTRTKEEYKNQTQPEFIITNGATGGGTGNVTQVYYLQHNQEVTLTGIPLNATVKITEDQEDYTTAVTPVGTFATGSEDPEISNDNTDVLFTVTGDTGFTFTNTRAGTIPTGILSSVVPGTIVVILAGVCFAVISKKRKEEYSE